MIFKKEYFEYYEVDPISWSDIKKLDCLFGANITRDLSSATLSSASFSTNKFINEAYIRVYYVCEDQNNMTRIPMGTFLVQTPRLQYSNKSFSCSLQAYSSLIELKENKVPLGYSYDRKHKLEPKVFVENIFSQHLRPKFNKDKSYLSFTVNDAPKVFIAENQEDWLSFLESFLGTMKTTIRLDDTGLPYIFKSKEFKELVPVYTYNDDENSILFENLSIEYDLYSKPNVLNVHFVNAEGRESCTIIRKNEDIESPFSIQNRGRIIEGDTEIVFYGNSNPSKSEMENMADSISKDVFSITYTVQYVHGYSPVNIGDAVILNYHSAGLDNIKAIVTNQSISCQTGLQIQETATFKLKNFIFDW